MSRTTRKRINYKTGRVEKERKGARAQKETDRVRGEGPRGPRQGGRLGRRAGGARGELAPAEGSLGQPLLVLVSVEGER